MIYTLSLHDALPIWHRDVLERLRRGDADARAGHVLRPAARRPEEVSGRGALQGMERAARPGHGDRQTGRLAVLPALAPGAEAAGGRFRSRDGEARRGDLPRQGAL